MALRTVENGWRAILNSQTTSPSSFAERDELKRLATPGDSESSAAEKPAQAVGTCRATGSPLIPFAARREHLEPGTIFAGQYRIRRVTEGGMGRVYFDDAVSPDRGETIGRVAIKTIAQFEEWHARQRANKLPGERESYERIVSRFKQEAEVWVRIGKQPNVLWAFFVLDVGGKPYVVMEFAEDGDLRSFAVNLAIQFCRGMTQAIEACGLSSRHQTGQRAAYARASLEDRRFRTLESVRRA